MRALTLGLLLLLTACGMNISKEGMWPKDWKGIIGGTQVAEKAPIASGIVAVYDIKDEFLCTGSIIANQFVLTAAHCATSKKQNLRIIFGLNVDAALDIREPDVKQTYVRSVVAVSIHPGFGKAPEDQEFDLNDIAVMKFQGDLPPGYRPVQLLNDGSVLRPGVMVRVAGYGVTKVDLSSVDSRKYPHLQDALESGEVICDSKQKNCLKIEMSEDGELQETVAPIAFVHSSEVQLDESDGHGTCSGDSGGPAYYEKEGQLFLFGVTSRGSPACDQTGVYTNAIYFKEWIQKALKSM